MMTPVPLRVDLGISRSSRTLDQGCFTLRCFLYSVSYITSAIRIHWGTCLIMRMLFLLSQEPMSVRPPFHGVARSPYLPRLQEILWPKPDRTFRLAFVQPRVPEDMDAIPQRAVRLLMTNNMMITIVHPRRRPFRFSAAVGVVGPPEMMLLFDGAAVVDRSWLTRPQRGMRPRW